MIKKSTTFTIFLFLFIVTLLGYLSYSIYCNSTIKNLKREVVSAQKEWTNYFRIVNKVNSKELSYISNSPNLINNLSKLDLSIQKNIREEINSNLMNLEDYSYSKLSNDIDLIVIYSSDGIVRAGFEKDSEEIPYINIPETITQVLDGENIALNIDLKGNLYYLNISPVTNGSKTLGAVGIGKKINNNIASYIKELTGVYLVTFTKNKLLASSLPIATAERLFEKFRQIDPDLINFLNNSNPSTIDKVEFLTSEKSEFWAAGNYIVNKASGYLLLIPNSRWVRPYMAINNNMHWVFPITCIFLALVSLLLSKVLNDLFGKISVKSNQTTDKISKINKRFNKQIDRNIDTFLNKVLAFLNMEFFRSNKELKEVSNTFYSMVKEYKAKMVVENFSSNPNITQIINTKSSDNFTTNTRKVSIYHSNVKDFMQLIEFFTPARAFTLLSIYLKIQQEIIAKHNGKMIRQFDDKLVAVFESNRHAEDAIRAAFEVQNTIQKLSTVNPENIELSIAISSGNILNAYLIDKECYIGNPDKIAARLCNDTPASYIYIDKRTYDHAGIKDLKAKQDMIVVENIKSPVQFYKFNPDEIMELYKEELEKQLIF